MAALDAITTLSARSMHSDGFATARQNVLDHNQIDSVRDDAAFLLLDSPFAPDRAIAEKYIRCAMNVRSVIGKEAAQLSYSKDFADRCDAGVTLSRINADMGELPTFERPARPMIQRPVQQPKAPALAFWLPMVILGGLVAALAVI